MSPAGVSNATLAATNLIVEVIMNYLNVFIFNYNQFFERVFNIKNENLAFSYLWRLL